VFTGRHPVVVRKNNDLSICIRAGTVRIVANKILIDLSNNLAFIGAGPFVTKLVREFVFVSVIVHLLKDLCRNCDSIFETLCKFVFLALVADAVEVVECSLYYPSWIETGKLELSYDKSVYMLLNKLSRVIYS
jgi:hypothetical protein